MPAVNCCSDQVELIPGSKASNVTLDSYPQSRTRAETNKQIAAPDMADSSAGVITDHYKSLDESVITVNSSMQTETDDANDGLSTRPVLDDTTSEFVRLGGIDVNAITAGELSDAQLKQTELSDFAAAQR
jgi:hypothetical protein